MTAPGEMPVHDLIYKLKLCFHAGSTTYGPCECGKSARGYGPCKTCLTEELRRRGASAELVESLCEVMAAKVAMERTAGNLTKAITKECKQ